eukprot:TRINITY_DN20466_c0_g1_i1.p1 TRINITY_DN20466_c0_g1~~TRINITY_DN20466_c0_g1_i1.p1  ORF type:complete len:302 (-),score=79.23 TRINITY_DN20466_c0_g1_i1:98-1003(-)
MIFPRSWPPWLMRKIIDNGSYLKNYVKGERTHSIENKKITIKHYGTTEEIKLPVRVYTPDGPGPFPIVVFFHGGGWVICSIESHDSICRYFCNHAECVVISVDYRLAPEYKFPIPVEDAYASAVYISQHAQEFNGDASRICLAGDSAGGNLSTVTTILSRDRGGPSFCGQLLIYPSCDLTGKYYPSHSGKCLNLTENDSRWFSKHYITPEQRSDPRASPILIPDLSRLPPALVVTGEHDRIRDVGEAYGDRLAAAGNATTMKRFDNVGHGFLLVSPGEEAKAAFEYMSDWLILAFSNKHKV